jgi:hypothetical protein
MRPHATRTTFGSPVRDYGGGGSRMLTSPAVSFANAADDIDSATVPNPKANHPDRTLMASLKLPAGDQATLSAKVVASKCRTDWGGRRRRRQATRSVIF